MPDTHTNHPDHDLLMAFGMGRLEPDASLAVESHLEACPRCCDTLLSLQDDTFVALLRQSGGPAGPDAKESTPPTAADTPEDANSRHRPEVPSLDVTVVSESGAGERGTAGIPLELAEHPRYRIVELIGRGGMGDVYKAEHRLMHRTVALKVINRELVRHRQAVERFRREVQAAARLSHPNIVTSHDAEQAGDVHFLVMEYVDGINLSEVVKRDGPLDVHEACEYIRQAAAGLQHAHEQGMVHRDIKPHNLMVTTGGQVKILDFGLATLSDVAQHLPASGGRQSRDEINPTAKPGTGHLTTAGTMMGTPDFISPEQAGDARSVDIRSDIYSLGCTLYYLLSGRPPFDEGSVMDRVQAHADSEAVPVDSVRADVPAELAEVLRRMLAKDPAERFQTPAEVADALAPFVDQHRSGPPEIGRGSTTDDRPARLSALDRYAIGVACLMAACLLLAQFGLVASPALAMTLNVGVALGVLFTWWRGKSTRPHGLTAVGWIAAALSVATAGVITLVTDRGTLEVETVDETVDIVISQVTDVDEQSGRVIGTKFVDRVSGSTVTVLPSGEYVVQLEGNTNEFALDTTRFVLKRGGKVLVQVSPVPPHPTQNDKFHPGVTGRPAIEGAWTPPEDPDPQMILDEASEDAREGRFATALAKHVWYHEHALDIDPAISGVRLSFALMNWKELAVKYPPALTRMKQFRDEAADRVLSANDPFQAFLDFKVLSEYLGEKERVAELFKRLQLESPERAEKVLRLVEPASPRLTQVQRYEGLDTFVHHLDLSRDGRWLLAGSGNPYCVGMVWELESGRIVSQYDDHQSMIFRNVFTPDGTLVAMVHWDGTLTLWDPRTGEHRGQMTNHEGRLEYLAVSPDGKYLATGTSAYSDSHSLGDSADVSFRIFDLAKRELVHRHNFVTEEAQHGGIWEVQFSPDGTKLLVAVEIAADATIDSVNAGFVDEFEVGTWKKTRRLCSAPQDGSKVRALRYSPDGRWIATGHQALSIPLERWWDDTTNSVIRLWDAETFKLKHTLRGHRSGIRSLDFSPDSRWLVSGNGYQWQNTVAVEAIQYTIRVWDVTTGNEVTQVEVDDTIQCVRFTPDGKSVVSSSGGLGQEPVIQRWSVSGIGPRSEPDPTFLSAADPAKDLPLIDVASPQLRTKLESLISAARLARTDEDWRKVFTEHAPLLAEEISDDEAIEEFGKAELAQMQASGHTLIKLLANLPDDVIEDLLQTGYLKWQFTRLDEGRQDEMRAALASLLNASSKMGFPAGLVDNVPQMLASGDVGFSLVNTPQGQGLVWYLLMPTAPLPMMFPLLGAGEEKNDAPYTKSVYRQLGDLEDKPYSDLGSMVQP